MRNYIILNNKNSNTISGLIIQELAPISKPQQRTQVETIDGRDGDIVTPLGYAAYNKKIKIGLYGNFDINEIIAYFATKGTAIFSNEPDKYYNYQILDQIDYERLVRFRVATVTMHVQPFKYSATEGTITVDSSDTVSDEGSNIVLENTAEAPFTTLRYKGNATQDGTPTPDNPIEIKVLTGDSTVKITGKNLFDKDNADTANGYLSGSTGAFVAGGGSYATKNATLLPAGDYVASRMLEKVCHYALDGSYIGLITRTGSNNEKFTMPSVGYVRLQFPSSFNADTFQLELGSTATAYEPYISQNYVIPFGDTYLAKIGDYADEPVKVGDTWYIRRAVGKVVLDGNANINVYNTQNSIIGFRAFTNETIISSPSTIPTDGLLSDHYQVASFVNFYTAQTRAYGTICVASSEIGNFYITAPNSSVTTEAQFKTWLASNPTTVYYALAEPTDEEITDQALIDALDDFYDQAHAYKGHTHITATAEDGNAPAVLAVEVGEDNESTVTNAGNTTSRPILTIYGQGNIGMYINDVQVLYIALGDEQYITIDSVAMEAYKDTTANLKNRLVTGDYSKLALNAGANKIYFTGNVTKYEISKYSRWL